MSDSIKPEPRMTSALDFAGLVQMRAAAVKSDEKVTKEQRKEMLRRRRLSKAAEDKAARRASHGQGQGHGGEPPAKRAKGN